LVAYAVTRNPGLYPELPERAKVFEWKTALRGTVTWTMHMATVETMGRRAEDDARVRRLTRDISYICMI
jgi:hypothetical protein